MWRRLSSYPAILVLNSELFLSSYSVCLLDVKYNFPISSLPLTSKTFIAQVRWIDFEATGTLTTKAEATLSGLMIIVPSLSCVPAPVYALWGYFVYSSLQLCEVETVISAILQVRYLELRLNTFPSKTAELELSVWVIGIHI